MLTYIILNLKNKIDDYSSIFLLIKYKNAVITNNNNNGYKQIVFEIITK